MALSPVPITALVFLALVMGACSDDSGGTTRASGTTADSAVEVQDTGADTAIGLEVDTVAPPDTTGGNDTAGDSDTTGVTDTTDVTDTAPGPDADSSSATDTQLGLCVDEDEDGYGVDCPLGPDCDDGDPNRYRLVLVDHDGDGFGAAGGDEACAGDDLIPGHTVDDGDCNDRDAGIGPGAWDIPADGIDQDCNGKDARFPSDLSRYIFVDGADPDGGAGDGSMTKPFSHLSQVGGATGRCGASCIIIATTAPLANTGRLPATFVGGYTRVSASWSIASAGEPARTAITGVSLAQPWGIEPAGSGAHALANVAIVATEAGSAIAKHDDGLARFVEVTGGASGKLIISSLGLELAATGVLDGDTATGLVVGLLVRGGAAVSVTGSEVSLTLAPEVAVPLAAALATRGADAVIVNGCAVVMDTGHSGRAIDSDGATITLTDNAVTAEAFRTRAVHLEGEASRTVLATGNQIAAKGIWTAGFTVEGPLALAHIANNQVVGATTALAPRTDPSTESEQDPVVFAVMFQAEGDGRAIFDSNAIWAADGEQTAALSVDKLADVHLVNNSLLSTSKFPAADAYRQMDALFAWRIGTLTATHNSLLVVREVDLKSEHPARGIWLVLTDFERARLVNNLIETVGGHAAISLTNGPAPGSGDALSIELHGNLLGDEAAALIDIPGGESAETVDDIATLAACGWRYCGETPTGNISGTAAPGTDLPGDPVIRPGAASDAIDAALDLRELGDPSVTRDLEGRDRPIDGDQRGGAAPDIGAIEHQP